MLLVHFGNNPNLPILYVDITPISEVAVYRYDETGVLSFVRTVKDSGAAPCWAVVNHTGTRLYATNTGDNSISVYDLTDPLNPVEIQHFVMDSTTGAPFSTVIDQSDHFLYVVSEQSSADSTAAGNAFHTLKVNPDGTLTQAVFRFMQALPPELLLFRRPRRWITLRRDESGRVAEAAL
jgi:6-phosphogluconolactonase (cycloisomerase 2 family)